jgi:hypothetical protein
MRGRLQLPDGDFLFELSYERGGLLCPSQRASLTTWTSPVGTACLRGIGRRLSQKMRSMLRTGAWPSNAPASHEILLKSLMMPRVFLSDHAVIACAVVDRTCVAVAFFMMFNSKKNQKNNDKKILKKHFKKNQKSF